MKGSIGFPPSLPEKSMAQKNNLDSLFSWVTYRCHKEEMTDQQGEGEMAIKRATSRQP